MRNTSHQHESEKAVMTIQKTRKDGKGFVMFGAINGDLGKWFEQWFATVEKAQAFASRKGWDTVVK